MGIPFNADEIFEMAVRTEENGAMFYRRAAKLRSNPKEISFLLGLAQIEDGHKATFESMRTELAKREKGGDTFDPDNETAKYLDALADGSGVEGSPKVADRLTTSISMREILEIAIGLEKNSILFYIAVVEWVPSDLGRERVMNIIREEKAHVAALAKELRKQDT